MILALFIFAAFLSLLILGYRSRAHSAEARANRAEGALDESRSYARKMRDIAALAIRESARAASINPDEVLPRYGFSTEMRTWENEYIPQREAHCPQCSVSVRHDPSEYPVKCPACSTLIVLPDDPLNADLIG